MNRELFLNADGNRAMGDTLQQALYQDAFASADHKCEVPLQGKYILRYLRSVVDEALTNGVDVPDAWLNLRLNPGIYSLESRAQKIAAELKAAGIAVTEMSYAASGSSRILSFEAFVAAQAAAAGTVAPVAAQK